MADDPVQALAAKYGATATPLTTAAPATATADMQALAAKYGASVEAQPATGNVLDDPRNRYLYTTPSGIPVYNREPYTQPEGSALSRVGQGAWEYTGGGIWNLVKGLTSIAAHGTSPIMLDPESDGAKLISGIVQSHIDQAQQAKAALDRKDYVEALGLRRHTSPKRPEGRNRPSTSTAMWSSRGRHRIFRGPSARRWDLPARRHLGAWPEARARGWRAQRRRKEPKPRQQPREGL